VVGHSCRVASNPHSIAIPRVPRGPERAVARVVRAVDGHRRLLAALCRRASRWRHHFPANAHARRRVPARRRRLLCGDTDAGRGGLCAAQLAGVGPRHLSSACLGALCATCVPRAARFAAACTTAQQRTGAADLLPLLPRRLRVHSTRPRARSARHERSSHGSRDEVCSHEESRLAFRRRPPALCSGGRERRLAHRLHWSLHREGAHPRRYEPHPAAHVTPPFSRRGWTGLFSAVHAHPQAAASDMLWR
jgi:hypothetical protein